MTTAIEVENLGKQYRIGNHAPYARFTELLVGAAKAPFSYARQKLAVKQATQNDPAGQASPERTFWALRNVNFKIEQGQIVGVIGRNGAGKSTLLKLLSRITEPSEGRIRYRGRVGSLLEVGTGFHPELTGRDNIYLNGAILGMTRSEIRKKFDEIVAFSEVEKFLDTAVKHYSSGMYTRLAFAVAAHLEPEILLVDEVLAVGDAEFQKKCLGKMGEVAKGGRTVLFVSHNMAAVERLCSKAIYLERGSIRYDGSVSQAMSAYMSLDAQQNDGLAQPLEDWPYRYGSGEARIVSAAIHDMKGRAVKSLAWGESYEVRFVIDSPDKTPAHLSAVCKTNFDAGALHLSQYDGTLREPIQLLGRQEVRFAIQANRLMPGQYIWNLGIHTPTQAPIDVVCDVLSFQVTDGLERARPFESSNRVAGCWAEAQWRILPG